MLEWGGGEYLRVIPTYFTGEFVLNAFEEKNCQVWLKINFWSGSGEGGGIFQGIPPRYENLPLQGLGWGKDREGKIKQCNYTL